MGSSSKWKIIIYYYAITVKKMKAMSQQLYDQFDIEQTLKSYQSTRGKRKKEKKTVNINHCFSCRLSFFKYLHGALTPFIKKVLKLQR